MQKFSAICTIFLMLFTATAFGDAIIGPKLAKALEKNTRGETFPVLLSLKKQIKANKASSKEQILAMLQDECLIEQNFLLDLCRLLKDRGEIAKLKAFWIANAISIEATASAIRELVAQPDIYAVVLDEKQVMIAPIESAPSRDLNGLDMVRSGDANNNGFTGEGVTVAVVDTGIDSDHSAFSSGQIITGLNKSFVDDEPTIEDGNGHGTHCAGTVGGHTFGVAPGCSLFAVKVLNSAGSGTLADVTDGVQYAAQNADVVSMSLGARASIFGNSIEDAVENAIAAGVVFSIAAGNEGPSNRTIGTPGVVKEAITVGAVADNGTIASFSSRGPSVYGDEKPDIVAPGVGVTSAWKNGDTNTISGTSMATPHVAGLIALILGKNPNLSPAEVKDIIMQTAKGNKQANVFGEGLVDCVDALAATR